MKKRLPNPAMYAPKADREKQEEPKLDLTPCENPECKKPIDTGYYSHWNDGGVCCRECDKAMKKIREAWYDSNGGTIERGIKSKVAMPSASTIS